MLTALDGEAQQLQAFGMDIDDYVTKPFSMPVLLEKIRVILRRCSPSQTDGRLRYRDILLDPDAREVLLDGRPLDLTAREFGLLHTFLAAPGRVFTREMPEPAYGLRFLRRRPRGRQPRQKSPP